MGMDVSQRLNTLRLDKDVDYQSRNFVTGHGCFATYGLIFDFMMYFHEYEITVDYQSGNFRNTSGRGGSLMIENLNLIKGKDCHSTSLLSGITEVSVIINEGKFVIEHQLLIKYGITTNTRSSDIKDRLIGLGLKEWDEKNKEDAHYLLRHMSQNYHHITP